MTDILTGDENGYIKLIYGDQYYRFGEKQSRSLGVCGLASARDTAYLRDARIAVLRQNNTLEMWKMYENGMIGMIDSMSLSLSDPLRILSLSSSNRFLSFDRYGQVLIHSFNLQANQWEIGQNSTLKFNIPGPISTGSTTGEIAAFGGNENDLKIYDINTFQPVWEAKNVPPDHLNLRVPIWITDVKFLGDSGVDLITGTGHKQVRIYDTRASRQPTVSMDVSEDHRVTVLLPSPDGQDVFYGDNAGGVYQWDLRMRRRKHTLKGASGSIRDLQMSPSKTSVVAVGLDRFLRVYSLDGEPLSQSYLKNRLTSCLVFDQVQSRKNGHDKDDDDEDDDDQGGEIEDRVEEYEDSINDDSSEDHLVAAAPKKQRKQ